MERNSKDSDPTADRPPEEQDEDPVPHTPHNEDELVDKESADSFPASDPPPY